MAETKASVGDVESARGSEKDSDIHLLNDAVRTFTWQSISVKVPDRDTKGEKTILSNVSGNVKAGRPIHTICVSTFQEIDLELKGSWLP